MEFYTSFNNLSFAFAGLDIFTPRSSWVAPVSILTFWSSFWPTFNRTLLQIRLRICFPISSLLAVINQEAAVVSLLSKFPEVETRRKCEPDCCNLCGC